MPEYSSTTLTPTNETKVPAMQNNSSGNFQLDALKAYILAEKAQANGLASLDATGKLVSSQIPDNLDDVLVYGSYALLPATGVEGKIYITADTNSMYRWDASLETPDYVMLAVDLEEYATKAELQAETNQRKASDSRLESRLENLEQKAGDYITVQYRGTNAVPTGKAKYGLVKSFVGKSRAWNQLYTRRTTGSYTEKGISFTFNDDGSITVGGNSPQTATGLIIMQASPTFDSYGKNHKLLLFGCPQGGSDNGFYLGALNSGNGRFNEKDTGSGTIVSVGGTYGLKYLIINIESGTTINSAITFKPILRDLTFILPEGVPSTVAECVQKCPDLLKYDAYNTSLVDETLSGAKSKGVNVWDEEWEVGNIEEGNPTPSNNRIRVKNFIPCLPLQSYFFYCGNANSTFFTFFYDAEQNFVSATSFNPNTFVQIPAGCFYLKFRCSTVYGTTYNHDIQICSNSLPDAIKTVYHPYKTDTLSLSETVTLRSAESFVDELGVESGVITRRINRIPDLSTMNWASIDSSSAYSYIFINDRKSGVVPFVANFPSTIKEGQMNANNLGFVIYFNAGTFSNVDQLKSALSGCSLNYPLATPTTESIDPIIDNFIEVEGGGTVETIQTQTPVIDNCLDVGYLTL